MTCRTGTPNPIADSRPLYPSRHEFPELLRKAVSNHDYRYIIDSAVADGDYNLVRRLSQGKNGKKRVPKDARTYAKENILEAVKNAIVFDDDYLGGILISVNIAIRIFSNRSMPKDCKLAALEELKEMPERLEEKLELFRSEILRLGIEKPGVADSLKSNLLIIETQLERVHEVLESERAHDLLERAGIRNPLARDGETIYSSSFAKRPVPRTSKTKRTKRKR